MQTTELLELGHHVAGGLTPIEAVAAVPGDALETHRQRRQSFDLARAGRAPRFEQMLFGTGVASEPGDVALPVGGDPRAHHKALLGKLNGRLQQALDWPRAVVLQEAHPAADGAGHRYGVWAVGIDAREIGLAKPSGGGALRGAA